ncbi:beta-N-acetylglucosaminidase domain-containing protein [Mycoplasma sp. 5370]
MKKKNKLKKFIPFIGISPLFFASASFENSISHNHETYNINPYVKSINYLDKNYVLDSEVNLVIEDGISQKTIDNFKNILTSKNYKFTLQKKIIESKTNILIGNKLNTDTSVDNLLLSDINSNSDISSKEDSYILTSKNNIIGAFGFKEDSEFYAAQTFKQILDQLKNRTIEEFVIKDFSMAKNRGIIEGSLNTNWSNIERFKYLEYAKKQKLNKYFYWNTFDKKTNEDWKLKYSNLEKKDFLEPFINKSLESNIEPVFMFNIFAKNKLREESFDNDLENFKQKILELTSLKVSKFGFIFNENSEIDLTIQQKFFTKFKEWFDTLEVQNKQVFIALNNLDIINSFDKNQANIVSKLKEFINTIPSDFEIITNPGKTFNTINNQFINDFIEITGRSKITLWSNWINLSNKQNNLILGGISQNLNSSFDENKLDGVLLNPSLFFEHSEIPLFALSSYLWNNFNNETEKNKLYDDSLKKLIGNQVEYKELIELFKKFSSHSLFENISIENGNEESVELKEKIINLQNLLDSKNYTVEQINEIKTDFINLKNDIYKLKNYYFKNPFIKEFSPWIDSFYDLNQGIIYLLNALINLKNNQLSEFTDNLSLGKYNVNNSRENHLVTFKNILVNPRVGTKYIQPFATKLINFLDAEQQSKLNIEKNINQVTLNYITNRPDTPENDYLNIFVPNNKEDKIYKDPNRIVKDDYFGVEFSEPIRLNSIYFKMGGGRDHFFYSRLQYKQNEGNWKNLNDEIYTRLHNNINPITVNNLNITNVTGIRLITTQNNPEEAWLRVTNILINQNQVVSNNLNYTDLQENREDSTSDIAIRENGTIALVKDNNYATQLAYSDSQTGAGSSKISEGKIIAFKFPSKRVITRIELDQGNESGRDRLNNFKVEYYDYNSNSWKLFSSKDNWGNQFNHIIYGYAFTDRFRFVNNQTVNYSWWRIANLRIGYDNNDKKQEYIAELDNARILGREEIRSSEHNNNISYIVDNSDYTSAVMAATDNTYVKENTGFKINFKYPRSIDEINILQTPKFKISSVKIQKIVNNEFVDVMPNVQLNDTLTTIKLPENSGVFTGIRILSNQNTESFWEVKSVNFKFKGINSKEYELSNISQKDNLTTSYSNNEYKLFSLDKSDNHNQYNLNIGEYIGLDLKSTKTINSVDLNWQENANIDFLSSIDGVNWFTFNKENITNSPVPARYLILRNKSENPISLIFNHLFIQTEKETTFGKLIDTNIEESDNDTFKGNLAFDGDFTTVSKINKKLKINDYLAYDLGSNIDLNSIKIFSDLENINWLRSAEIQISKDNSSWETIYSADAYGSKYSYKKLKDTNFGFYDSKYPEYRYWGVSDLINKKARYIKILINSDYPNNRSLYINEILINDGNIQSKNNVAGFSGVNIESKDTETTVLNLIDQKLTTYYEPKNENGKLTYSFGKNDYNNKYLNIVSIQEASLAEVFATIYNEENHQKREVKLGNLVSLNTGFNLPIDDHNKIISISIKWTNKKPKIAQILFLDKDNSINNEVDKTELETLINTRNEQYENWIQEDKDLYDFVISKGQLANTSTNLNQNTVNAVINEIKNVIANAKQKANLNQLNNLISEKIENINHKYTENSYSQYWRIYNSINKIVNENLDITEETINKLVSLYNEVKTNLEISIYNQEEARLNLRHFNFLHKEVYTVESVNRLKSVTEEIKQQLQVSLINEDKYKELNLSYQTNYEQLEYNKLGEFNEKYKNEIRLNFENTINTEWVNWENLSKELQKEFIKKDEIIMSDNYNLRDKKLNLDFLNNLFNSFIEDKNNQINLFKKELVFDSKYKEIYNEEVFNKINQLIQDSISKIESKTLQYTEISFIKEKIHSLKLEFDITGINQKIDNLLLENEVKKYKLEFEQLEKNEEQILDFLNNLKSKKDSIEDEIEKTNNLILKVQNPNRKEGFQKEKDEAKSEKELKEIQLKISKEIEQQNKIHPFIKIGLPIILSLSFIGLIALIVLFVLKKRKNK